MMKDSQRSITRERRAPPALGEASGARGAGRGSGPDHACGHDLVCFSHLRWNFVFQRPQHLLSRFARDRRVLYFEEPILGGSAVASLDVRRAPEGPTIATPRLPAGLAPEAARRAQRSLLDQLIAQEEIERPTLWYCTPMALEFTRALSAQAVIYDCMDELSAFKNAPPELVARERELMALADVVFTGGQSLFEAKRHRHGNIHPFPSSIDVAHFAAARAPRLEEPADQASIPGPRVGFFGVIDERLDADLIRACAERRPDWQFVMIGPTAKIDPATLPRRPNLHWLGSKPYAELPAYVAGWAAAILPFARNESTRFISPTKTPEYLAAGKPVVSTSIADVARPYGELGLAEIADEPAAFEAALARGMDRLAKPGPARTDWLRQVDRFLAGRSWDDVHAAMARLEWEAI